MRRAASRDANEREIIDALRARGHLVQQLSDPGVPDLIVASSKTRLRWLPPNIMEPFTERLLTLLEIKMPRNQRGDPEPLKPLEKAFHKAFTGWPVYVVTTPEEAICRVENE